VVLGRTSRLERKHKFSYNSNLKTKVSHMGLYTMGRNTKRPNTTKGPMKPKQKHYKNYKRVPNPRSLSKGIGHDSINFSDDPEPRLHQEV